MFAHELCVCVCAQVCSSVVVAVGDTVVVDIILQLTLREGQAQRI